MLDAINGLSDVGFVLFVLAVLMTLYTLMVGLGWVLKGVGFSYLGPFLAVALWIALWFVR
jgi:hypothetical protein